MHTNQTVNYALSQFIGTDIPNPLTDYNGDMAKIDTAIKNIADASTDNRDDIAALKVQNGNETLDTTAQTLSGAVNELNSGYGDVNTRLTTAEGKITADEGTLATVVGNVSTLAGKVSTVETKVGTAVLTTTASDLSGAVNELDADIATESGKIVALQNQNGSEVLQTTAQTLSGAINELNGAKADKTLTLIATSGSGDLGTQLDSLKSAFNALTFDQKARAIIIEDDVLVFHVDNINGKFYYSGVAGEPVDNSRTDYFDLINGKAYRVTCSNNGVAITDSITNLTVDAGLFKLYV